MGNKKRYLLIILGIVLISILGTFAWLTWKSKDTSLVLTIGDISGTTVTLKPYMIEQSLIPTLTYEGNEVINVTAKNNGTTENDIVLYYEINNIDEELITDSFKYTVLKNTDGVTYEEYQTGNFASANVNEEFIIIEETIPVNTTYNYRVYTWLDGENETSSNIQGKSFKAELRAGIYNGKDVIVDVPSGLIPVTIANDGVVTTISQDDEEWYDYNNKLWANGVLVTESSRSTYLGTTGVTIPEDNILAYYVYVPRYKYKIWTTGTSATGQEQEIEILFENKTILKSRGTKVGEYRTHPGFTFGGEELNGIWVGKFETTGTGEQPTVKPNVSSLRNQNVSTQFQTGLKFAGGVLSYDGVTSFSGSSAYGLNDSTNSHMAKNTEWAAAAYLSHSQYGINTEVRINNYYNNETKTGCGASTADASESTNCEIVYGNATSYPQSTTGNITGIFDMSGGAWEKVMGVFANSDGALWSGNSSTENSGFNGLLGTSGLSYTSGIDFPKKKYYDIYKASNGVTIDRTTACNGEYCYGHGVSETFGWYGDYADFVSSFVPWIDRGGGRHDGIYAGMFSFGSYFGTPTSYYGFRTILTTASSEDKLKNKMVLKIRNAYGGTLKVNNLTTGEEKNISPNIDTNIIVNYNDEVSFSANPNTNFSLVSLKKNAGSIDNNSKIKITDNIMINTSYKRDDYGLFWLDAYKNVSFSPTLSDGNTSFSTGQDSTRHHYTFVTNQTAHRLGVASDTLVDVTEFNYLCSQQYTANNTSYITSGEFYLGLLTTREWTHNQNIIARSSLPIISTSGAGVNLCGDISNYSGNYYIGFELLQFTSSDVSITTYVHYVNLIGAIYI